MAAYSIIKSRLREARKEIKRLQREIDILVGYRERIAEELGLDLAYNVTWDRIINCIRNLFGRVSPSLSKKKPPTGAMPSERGVDLATDRWDSARCVESCKAIAQLAQQWNYVPQGNVYGVNVLAFVKKLHDDLLAALRDASTSRQQANSAERWLDNIRQHIENRKLYDGTKVPLTPEMICTSVVALLDENKRLLGKVAECDRLNAKLERVARAMSDGSDEDDNDGTDRWD